MEHLSHYSATCKYKICICHCHDFYKRLTEIFVRENGESCWQVDDASLDPNHGQGNATIFQVRLIVRSIFQVEQICWIHLSSPTSFSHRDMYVRRPASDHNRSHLRNNMGVHGLHINK